ncbi:hypothetical protein A9C11_22995 [Pseudomonas citronellolis]|uniref:Cyanophage baseplate Pam3 plug gp18 domain-containing protein n=1 Tax=Pseudomonas citronellolis TaxID=53408 RepID=A0A1A9KGF5_9PSED|nr:Ig domain-containing protein [Pseudomonas citronellolis]ANI16657.1 hypothetical protein A9C11_22995 [Pseudomonas citronellolis]
MQIIPLAAVASQTLKVVLAQQNCVLNVYQQSTGIYLDVILEGETILAGVLCRDRVRCVRQAYLGFIGDLAFMDTEGTDDPVYSGLGSRWVLMYLSPEDLIEKTTSTSIDFQTRINAANAWASAHPLVLTGALNNGVRGVPYSSSITLQGQMNSSAISWSVVGSLPAGLSLDSRTGVVSGTPTAGLTIVSFTLTAKDNLGRTATSAQTVKIGQTFTMATSLPGIMSLTRPSIGTYFDPAAVLQVAANDQPRFDYDPVTLALRGLLVEEQRTNLLLRSSEFGNASWSKTRMSVVEDVAIAPDGTTSMDLLVPTTVSGNHQISQSVAVSGGSINALSFYVKAAGYNFVRLRIGDSVGYLVDAIADLANGVITNPSAASKIEPIGNGIYRLSMSATASVGATTLSLGVWVYDNSKAAEFVGDGVSGIYVWGAQIEAGAFPTSIIPTTSAQVTRAADVASITVPSGFTTLTYDYDDGTSLQETVSTGAHTIPTPVAPKRIKTISVTA